MKLILTVVTAVALLLVTQVFRTERQLQNSFSDLTTLRTDLNAAQADLAAARAEVERGKMASHQLESVNRDNTGVRRKLDEVENETADLRARGEYYKSQIAVLQREVVCGIGSFLADVELSTKKKNLLEVQTELGKRTEELAAANAEAASLEAALRSARALRPR